MSSTSTSRLGLFKPVPGSGEPFRTSDLNSNSDKIDAEAVAVDGRLDVVELAVGASGTVQRAVLADTATLATSATSATTATNLAGGAANRIPVQSAAGTTTFVAAPSAPGRVLTSQLTGVPAFTAFPDPVPFKMQVGIIPSGAGSWASGTSAVTFPTAFDSGIVPVVVLTNLGVSGSATTTVTLNATPTNTGFVARARTQTGTAYADAAPTTHWIAVQYSAGSGVS
jgi:hypothetical protein